MKNVILKFDHEYEITRDGKVFSVSSNWRKLGRREMRQCKNSKGYPSVWLIVNGKKKHLSVHKLVAIAYLGKKPSKYHQIRHIDGDRNNPALSNLAWGTAKDNAADRSRHGRTSKGKKHSKLVVAGQLNSKNKYFKHARKALDQ